MTGTVELGKECVFLSSFDTMTKSAVQHISEHCDNQFIYPGGRVIFEYRNDALFEIFQAGQKSRKVVATEPERLFGMNHLTDVSVGEQQHCGLRCAGAHWTHALYRRSDAIRFRR